MGCSRRKTPVAAAAVVEVVEVVDVKCKSTPKARRWGGATADRMRKWPSDLSSGFASNYAKGYASLSKKKSVLLPLVAVLAVHLILSLWWNHEPVYCPHHGTGAGPDMQYVIGGAEKGGASYHATEPFHGSGSYLYEEADVRVHEENDYHGTEEEVTATAVVKWATFGGPLFGKSLSRHANFHILDEYSLTHLEHGILAALFVQIVVVLLARLPKLRKVQGLIYQHGVLISVTCEAAWEVYENRPGNLGRYDSKNMKFCGDSLINSLCDVLVMLVGYSFMMSAPKWIRAKASALAGRRPFLKRLRHLRVVKWCLNNIGIALTVVALCEIWLLCAVKDSFLCSITQFTFASLGLAQPGFLTSLQEVREPLLFSPRVAVCHHR